jgi:hypothetical protein
MFSLQAYLLFEAENLNTSFSEDAAEPAKHQCSFVLEQKEGYLTGAYVCPTCGFRSFIPQAIDLLKPASK